MWVIYNLTWHFCPGQSPYHSGNPHFSEVGLKYIIRLPTNWAPNESLWLIPGTYNEETAQKPIYDPATRPEIRTQV